LAKILTFTIYTFLLKISFDKMVKYLLGYIKFEQ
jgi:hypothetical protein